MPEQETALPDAACKGLTFWPVPSFTDLDVAFGADASRFFRRDDLPDVPRKFREEASTLFFNGGKPSLGADVNYTAAIKCLRAWLSSFAPAHEAKEATVAYALWVWSPEAATLRDTTSKAVD